MEHQTTTIESASYSMPQELAHDLLTPLNQIIGYSEMLMERAGDRGQAEFLPDLNRVCLAGQRLLSVITDNFGGTDARAPNPIPSVTDLVLEAGSTEATGFLLVVDDDEGNRDVLTRRLQKQGYTVANAENGRQALEMLEADSYDLILLDIMMPEMDGFEVLRRLKSTDLLKHVPVIMVSALNEMESVAKCIEMGAEDYLTKPFNATLLQARLHNCLEKKRARDRERDLFERLERNYQRLQELERLRDDLTHMIVHDLRTPLTSVMAAIQTLSVVGQVNEVQGEVVDIALSGSRALLSMVNSLLDVEKLESGAMELERTPILASELISAAVAQVSALAQAKDIALIQAIDPNLSRFSGDERVLLRVLVNLVGNALKFTPAGGSVTLQADWNEDKQAVEFCVLDTGEGIPSEAFERIFEKFGQVGSRQAGRTMSTGLGLTFCKLATEAHGGQIGVESTLAKGSKFWFTVPAASPTSQPAEAVGLTMPYSLL